ncbi:TetR/AcrR family transcriptional regulator [Streptomyces sp. NPDC002671]
MTSRTQILTAARRLIDRDGWEKLTIRRLASELGIGATTLYHHIQNKEDLLVLLLNHYIDQLERPELPDDPRERIVTAATAMHDALAVWPWAAEILTVDGFVGLLDESAPWMVEAIVTRPRRRALPPSVTTGPHRPHETPTSRDSRRSSTGCSHKRRPPTRRDDRPTPADFMGVRLVPWPCAQSDTRAPPGRSRQRQGVLVPRQAHISERLEHQGGHYGSGPAGRVHRHGGRAAGRASRAAPPAKAVRSCFASRSMALTLGNCRPRISATVSSWVRTASAVGWAKTVAMTTACETIWWFTRALQ